MIKAFIAICLVTTAPDNCTRNSAIEWIVDQEPQASDEDCQSNGMAYAANLGLVRAGTYAKVFCVEQVRTP
jgi:hypothetical protein